MGWWSVQFGVKSVLIYCRFELRSEIFYLLTRGFNWELELNLKVAQSPYEREGYSLGCGGWDKERMLRHAYAAELTRTMLWVNLSK